LLFKEPLFFTTKVITERIKARITNIDAKLKNIAILSVENEIKVIRPVINVKIISKKYGDLTIGLVRFEFKFLTKICIRLLIE